MTPSCQRSYIVAATPRTGSSLLCEGLWATRIAGNPAEVFAPDFRNMWYQHWGLPPDTRFQEYVSTAIRKGLTANGVFGLKIQWMHVAVLAHDLKMPAEESDVLDALFPEAKFINIVRRDRLAQALSWHRANVTNEWWRFRDSNTNSHAFTIALDANAINALEEEIEQQQAAWENYFRARNQAALVIEYEELDKDYRAQVGRVLEFLGLDISVAHRIPEPLLMRQADGLNVQWRQHVERTRNEIQR